MSELDDYFERVEARLNPASKAAPQTSARPTSAAGVWKKIRAVDSPTVALLPALNGAREGDRAALAALRLLVQKHGADNVVRVGEHYVASWGKLRAAYSLKGPPGVFQFVRLFPTLYVAMGEHELPSSGEATDLSDW